MNAWWIRNQPSAGRIAEGLAAVLLGALCAVGIFGCEPSNGLDQRVKQLESDRDNLSAAITSLLKTNELQTQVIESHTRSLVNVTETINIQQRMINRSLGLPEPDSIVRHAADMAGCKPNEVLVYDTDINAYRCKR